MHDVITIGTATRDVFLTGNGFKILRDKEHLQKLGFQTGEAECFALGAKIEVEEPVFTVGGGAANAAVTFGRQGLNAGSVFKVGGDELGEAIVQTLKNDRVRSFAVKDKKFGTAYSTILITSEGERTILVYRGASEKMSENEISFKALKAKWFYIAPGTLPLSLMIKIIDYAKNQNAKIAMNPSGHYVKMGFRKLEPILKKLDVVLVNREEASSLTDIKYEDLKGIFRKFDALVSGIAVMTDGDKGAWASDGRYLYKAKTFKEKQRVDRTGAGDAFGSGFVTGLICKNDMNYALRLASANATSVVEAIGAQAGILGKSDFENKRWKYLDLDVEPL